ncbi:hypothetical protein ACFXTO_003206 [Malus domestica]
MELRRLRARSESAFNLEILSSGPWKIGVSDEVKSFGSSCCFGQCVIYHCSTTHRSDVNPFLTARLQTQNIGRPNTRVHEPLCVLIQIRRWHSFYIQTSLPKFRILGFDSTTRLVKNLKNLVGFDLRISWD